ncbi:hypothetical protein SAY87_029483 [Trapa incisa]|uniref:Uncharacterized protein n=1 Tax=Trapa incisa TaxID=236973 RepID=A0AAN7Q987_9MYRT|nr:hypothetical protein SAY87_029483 [Trapa incisa]
MTRRCSHCSHDGHNSRTCQNRVVKLFGVRINDGSSIRKSASMGNLSSRCSGSGSSSQIKHPVSPRETTLDHGGAAAADGYAAEDFVAGTSISSTCRRRKKGEPWTQEEHRLFLLGLQKLGKGDWRGISRNYVISRTPIQVASHAQKYYMRHSCNSRRKRRSSLFDMVIDEAGDMPRESTGLLSMDHPKPDAPSQDQSTAPPPPPVEEECESREATNSSGGGSQAVVTSLLSNIIYPFYPVICPPPPAYFSPFFPSLCAQHTPQWPPRPRMRLRYSSPQLSAPRAPLMWVS